MSIIDAAPVLELKDLSKAFGGLRAVRGVSLTIMPGDRKAIIGPNGAGKTTLFRMLTGAEPADSGEFRIGPTVKLAYVDQSR